ncbi:MAG: tetratricopeptide repeat protein [Spartobacteria bacterium]
MRGAQLITAAAIALSIFAVACGRSQAQSAIDDASKPLADGVPEVAVSRLRGLLGKNLAPEEWQTSAQKLIEALLAADEPEQALMLLDDARLRDVVAVKFWRGQALAGLKRWTEALSVYEAVMADASSPRRVDATFGAAEMLRALGRFDEALAKLTPLTRDERWSRRAQLRMAELYVDKSDAPNARRILSAFEPRSATERKVRRFLQGRVELVEHHPDRALAIFEPLLKRLEGASHSLVVATLFYVADGHLQMHTAEAGDDFIEDFIEHHPHDVDLARIFAKLDELYRSERKPIRSELERWTREQEQPRRAFAQWYLARIEMRAGHREKALRLFGEMRASHPQTPALSLALLDLAQLTLEDGRAEDALSILREARELQPEQPLLDRIDFLAAEADYRADRVDAAAAQFERIAYSPSPFAKMSIFNAALGRLELGDKARFATQYAQLKQQESDADARAQLRLQDGLSQAARGDAGAAQSLQNFVREFAGDPRVSEALVALAELAFHRSPPALDEARKYLGRATESKPTPAAAERGDYLSIWIEDAGAADGQRVIELANRFLERYPTSNFAPDVRMKLAESYYRRQDFANAQTHFEILVQQNPEAPLAERALFFAADSAMSSMGQNSLDRAVVLLDQVVQRRGELRWTARNEQALLERKLGKVQDALLLYDEVLKNDARASEKREALCGKADIYFDLGATDAKNYDRALEGYDALAHDAQEPGHWRNQALFKKGMCWEKKSDRASALNAFYEVVEGQSKPGKSPELFWFYKAGFNAARLLEETADWKSAATVYGKLVAASGPRSEEARSRLNRLRLEHFLWQE